MVALLTTVHVLACLFLVLVVLLQAGRGAGFAVFGGGGDALFASKSGSTALKKATVFCATTFAVTSLMLTLLSSRPGISSVTGNALNIPAPQAPSQPLAPQAPAAPAEGAKK